MYRSYSGSEEGRTSRNLTLPSSGGPYGSGSGFLRLSLIVESGGPEELSLHPSCAVGGLDPICAADLGAEKSTASGSEGAGGPERRRSDRGLDAVVAVDAITGSEDHRHLNAATCPRGARAARARLGRQRRLCCQSDPEQPPTVRTQSAADSSAASARPALPSRSLSSCAAFGWPRSTARRSAASAPSRLSKCSRSSPRL